MILLAVLLAGPLLSVAPLRSEIAGDAKVGSRRSGALCVPAGKVQWRDVSPDARDTAAAVARVLARRAEVFVPGPEVLDEGAPPGRYRIVPTVTAAALKACLPEWGIAKWGDKDRRIKASGTVTVQWRVFDTQSRAQVDLREVEAQFTHNDRTESLERVVQAAVVANADALATTGFFDALPR